MLHSQGTHSLYPPTPHMPTGEDSWIASPQTTDSSLLKKIRVCHPRNTSSPHSTVTAQFIQWKREQIPPPQYQQMVINALAGVVPIQAKMNCFGAWHPIELLAPFYRNGKLCWILKNHANDKLYLSCHFLADLLHAYHRCRPLLHHQTHHRYNRQSFNEVTILFKSEEDLKQNTGYKLNRIPKAILQFSDDPQNHRAAISFIQVMYAFFCVLCSVCANPSIHAF